MTTVTTVPSTAPVAAPIPTPIQGDRHGDTTAAPSAASPTVRTQNVTSARLRRRCRASTSDRKNAMPGSARSLCLNTPSSPLEHLVGNRARGRGDANQQRPRAVLA